MHWITCSVIYLEVSNHNEIFILQHMNSGQPGTALSVWRVATRWTVEVRRPVQARFARNIQTGDEDHPAS